MNFQLIFLNQKVSNYHHIIKYHHLLNEHVHFIFSILLKNFHQYFY